MEDVPIFFRKTRNFVKFGKMTRIPDFCAGKMDVFANYIGDSTENVQKDVADMERFLKKSVALTISAKYGLRLT